MEKSLIRTHLKTSNKYVQRQIVRDNVARLKNYLSTFKIKDIPTKHFRETNKQLQQQEQLLKKLNKAIAVIEDLSFAFGGISSSN